MDTPPVVTAKRVERPPRMDGRLSDGIWGEADRFTGFRSYSRTCEVRTECRLCFDRKFLYLGWRCSEPHIERLRCWHTETIQSECLRPLQGVGYATPAITSRDDYVHLLLDIHHDRRHYLEFLVNPLGRSYTARGVATKYELDSDAGWSCPGFRVLTHIGTEEWTVEMAIPFSGLGLGAIEDGHSMGINLRRQRTPGFEIQALALGSFAWSTQQTTSMVFVPEFFGVLVLGNLQENLARQRARVDKSALARLPARTRAQWRQQKARAAKPLSAPAWRRGCRLLADVEESLYWAGLQAQGGWFVWQSHEHRVDHVGLAPPLLRPPPNTGGLAALAVTVPAGEYTRVSFMVTNLGRSSRTPDLQVEMRADTQTKAVPQSVLETVVCPEMIPPRQTREAVLGIDAGGLDSGEFAGCLRVSRLTIPVIVTVTPPTLGEAPAPVTAGAAGTLPVIHDRNFWTMLDPMWRKPGLSALRFVNDSGTSVALMSLYLYLQKTYQVCARELELYLSHSEVNAAADARPIGSGPDHEAETLNDGNTQRAGIFAAGRYPVEGWFGLDFQGDFRHVRKLVIHHGRPFGKGVSGRKAAFLNIAKDFVVQYWDRSTWQDAPAARVRNNRAPVTVHEFSRPVLTRRIRVCVTTQSFAGIRYTPREWWKWWVEAGDAIGPGDPRRYRIDLLKDRLWANYPFERRFAKAPFSFCPLLTTQGKELVEYDREEETKAYRSLKKRFPNTFLGFFVHEWDSTLTHLATGVYSSVKWLDHPSRLPRLAPDRQKAHDTLRDAFLLLNRTTCGDFFAENCYKCWDHYALEWGSKLSCIELTQSGNPAYQIQIAFARGAARQYGRAWAAYLALYLGPSHPRPLPLSKDEMYDGMGASNAAGGCSPSAYYRTMVVCYMAGASLVYHENHILSRTAFDARSGAFSLSPHGQAIQQFHRLTRRHSDRGVPYVPVGLLLDYMHGWTVPYVTGKGFGVGGGRNVWLNTPFGKGEDMITEVMRLLFPWCVQRRERMGHFLTNSAFGDVFDVLVANPPSGTVGQNALERYGALVLLGEVSIDKALSDRLTRYVRQGGVLVVNRIHANVLGKENPRGRPFLRDTQGRVFATAATVGKGRIILCRPPYLNARPNHIHPMTSELLARVIAPLVPVHVMGNVQHLLNRKAASWVVTLVNNRGVYKEPDADVVVRAEEAAPVDVYIPGDAGAVREWSGAGNLSVLRRGSGKVVRLSVPPGGVRIVEINDR